MATAAYTPDEGAASERDDLLAELAERDLDAAEAERQSQPVSRWDDGYDGEG